jgi:hypothetical protein
MNEIREKKIATLIAPFTAWPNIAINTFLRVLMPLWQKAGMVGKKITELKNLQSVSSESLSL